MSKINNGGPAFPLQSIGPDFAPGYSGMTLRDWFAGQALVAMGDRRWSGDPAETATQKAARAAYAAADAMLKARETDK